MSTSGYIEQPMKTLRFIHWQEDDAWLGYVEDYPDYWTQGSTLDDLKEHLIEIYQDITGGQISGIPRADELVLP
jgi:predicted RNase H-like HicB family nuclease